MKTVNNQEKNILIFKYKAIKMKNMKVWKKKDIKEILKQCQIIPVPSLHVSTF